MAIPLTSSIRIFSMAREISSAFDAQSMDQHRASQIINFRSGLSMPFRTSFIKGVSAPCRITPILILFLLMDSALMSQLIGFSTHLLCDLPYPVQQPPDGSCPCYLTLCQQYLWKHRQLPRSANGYAHGLVLVFCKALLYCFLSMIRLRILNLSVFCRLKPVIF